MSCSRDPRSATTVVGFPHRDVYFAFRASLDMSLGYLYCNSCTDYQALMPRTGDESGYIVMPVCAYCIDFLTGEIRVFFSSFLVNSSIASDCRRQRFP